MSINYGKLSPAAANRPLAEGSLRPDATQDPRVSLNFSIGLGSRPAPNFESVSAIYGENGRLSWEGTRRPDGRIKLTDYEIKCEAGHATQRKTRVRGQSDQVETSGLRGSDVLCEVPFIRR